MIVRDAIEWVILNIRIEITSEGKVLMVVVLIELVVVVVVVVVGRILAMRIRTSRSSNDSCSSR